MAEDRASAFAPDSIWLTRSFKSAHSPWFCLFFTFMFYVSALIAKGGSVTTPAPAAWPDSNKTGLEGVRLSC